MRDRLIELLEQAESICDERSTCFNCVGYGKGRECKLHLYADYLLANGVIVPPCKVGDTVYCIIKEHVPDDDYRMSWHNETNILERKFTLSMIELFGKTVFLTKEEAERALKGGDEK